MTVYYLYDAYFCYFVFCMLHRISVNKNTVAGDKSALSPGGLRLGTAALTSRGFKAVDMVKVAEYLHRTVQLALQIQVRRQVKHFDTFEHSIPYFHAYVYVSDYVCMCILVL